MLARLARELLPARAQDFLRTVRDQTSPGRRAAAARRKVDAARDIELARKVSPDGRVLSGIFEGMTMPLEASWGGLSARVAGSYEEELAPDLAALIAAEPPVVIDAGSAEGYYAVGLARALPSSTVYAFDISRDARRVCRLAAARNGVRNLHVRGRIDPRQLRALLVPNALVLADVEGYETILLDPNRVPNLCRAAIIVEFHEWIVPGATTLVVDRFTATHHIKMIDSRPRDAFGRGHLSHLTAEEAYSAVQERPYSQQWAVMRPLQTK
jgi:hypothetical protein